MKKGKSIRWYSILFLGVFFVKMALSAAPLIVSHFDKKTVNAVIMQLEIENHAKSSDVKETSVKEFFTLGNFGLIPLHSALLVLTEMITVDHDKHIRAFYPAVPTPPPNC